ncbi:MAG: DUF3037 domain-containing protein [Taibaiella sp.]|nr:DUF3037 domain-containing protein [Taibaiella sp.]
MQEQHLFEYAVIRIVPKVEREEFLNVGVVLYCASRKFLQAKYLLDRTRISSFSPNTDIAEIEAFLAAFERICIGGNEGGTIGRLPAPDRFRWLSATRSTVVQCSKVHPGLCSDPAEMLERLFCQLVLQ